MGQHFVKVVEDDTLEATDGWAFVMVEETGEIHFVVERSAVADERILTEAWTAAKQLVIEQAVRDGLVEYTRHVPVETPVEAQVPYQQEPVYARGRHVLL